MSQKIRIKLKSYDHALVDKSADKIVKTVKATGAVVSGPIPLFPPLVGYLQFYSKDCRCPYEAGASQRSRGRNQGLILINKNIHYLCICNSRKGVAAA